jgi:hypothetical protein
LPRGLVPGVHSNNAQWHCLGKVIGKLSSNESYDLFQGSPIGYFAKEQIPQLLSGLNSDQINIQTTEPVVRGPALVVATMAIFA